MLGQVRWQLRIQVDCNNSIIDWTSGIKPTSGTCRYRLALLDDTVDQILAGIDLNRTASLNDGLGSACTAGLGDHPLIVEIDSTQSGR